jgi:site-specific DNA recombinase
MRRERDEANAVREVQLVMGQLESFTAQVREGLVDAQWPLQRDSIRALVKRIDVTDEHITMVFRVGTPSLGPAPPSRFTQHWLPRLFILAHQAGASASACTRGPFRR